MLDKFGEPRQQRGLEIAATAKIERKGGAWLVPSQSGNGRYTVIPHTDAPHCTCPDHQDGGHKCKHLFAVEYVLRRESNPDGTVTITEAVRKTYVQDWRAYNAAQTGEKEQFLELLRDLCGGVTEPERQKNGRPRLPISDAIFAACYKVYSTVSARRFMSDLRDAQAQEGARQEACGAGDAAMTTKTRMGTTHVIAQCRDCSWRDENYRTAEQAARRHAETTEHTVSVERAQAWTFNPKR